MKRIAVTILIVAMMLPCVALAAKAVLYSFRKGELTPRLYGRTDVVEFYEGCRLLENMFVKPQGPVEKRPGTYFVAEAAGEARVIGFVVSTGNSFALELSEGSIRFFK